MSVNCTSSSKDIVTTQAL